MAKLGIFTGTSPNDTTGDTLSQGAVKINSNFSEIYTALGDGTNITNSLSSITVAGLSTFTNGPVLIGSGIQTGTSKLQVSGDTFITGSVGIGTTNPTSKLHVIGGGNFTGIVSALSFSGNSSSASYATTAGIATYATNAGTSTSVIGGIGSITQLQVTGISTFTNGPVLIGGGTSTGTTGQVLQVTGISSGAYIGGSVGIGTTTPTESLHVVGNLKVTGTITGEVSSIVATARTSTNVIGGIGSITQLQVTGISTFTNGPILVGRATSTGTANQALQVESGAYFNDSVGIGTTNPSEKLSVYGAVESLYDTLGEGGQFILRGKTGTPIRWNIDNHSVGVTTNLFRIFKEDNSTGANGRAYVGITTIGEFIIGDGAGALSPTGTANQQLQVQSGAYIQNSLGIGITNPTSSLSVNGSTVIGTETLNMTGLSSTFTTVGSNTFTVPTGVTKISAVLIAGGGAGGGSNGGAGGNGGGGGGLVYINDYAVSPGQNLTVVVGGGGAGGIGGAGGDGGDSSITGVATAFGGKGGAATAGDNGSLGGSGGSNFANSGISNGGPSGKGTNTTGGGGGGSAGYSGNGGSGGGNNISGTEGSGGSGGGGSQGNINIAGNGGGGTGILGQGSSGVFQSNVGGGGGSGGANGVTASSTTGSSGGNYGGGGGGADGDTGASQSGGNGGQGVVRIIWSPSSKFSRLFPTNQVGNNINQ